MQNRLFGLKYHFRSIDYEKNVVNLLRRTGIGLACARKFAKNATHQASVGQIKRK